MTVVEPTRCILGKTNQTTGGKMYTLDKFHKHALQIVLLLALATSLVGCFDLSGQEEETGAFDSLLATPTRGVPDLALPTPAVVTFDSPLPTPSPGPNETPSAEFVPLTPTPTLPPVEFPTDLSKPALVDLSGLAAPGAHLLGVWFSHDGASIFYTLSRSGAGREYWRMDADLQNRVQIPGLRTILDPEHSDLRIWSPDDTKLLYRVSGQTPEIWLANADGTEPQRLDITGIPNAWSSDGQSIFYFYHDIANQTVTFWQMDLESGQHKRFFVVPEPYAGDFRWSPDGRQVAIGGGGEGWNNLYVANADGSDLRRLFFPVTQQFQSVGDDTWSPDGKMLAVTLASQNDESIGKIRKAWVINVATSDLWQLTDTRTASLYWNADDNRIYYVTGEKNTLFIWSINPDGTDQRLEAEFPGVYVRENLNLPIGTYADWSSDGKRLILWQQSPEKKFKLAILP
jgi:Tol biopolymer transport system component